jgi:ankyrin repeat protein
MNLILAIYFLTLSQSSDLIKEMNKSYPSEDVVAVLIDSGANIEGIDASGRTALAVGAQCNIDANCVNLLLQCGADPDTKDHNGNTPLMLALKYNLSREMVESLTAKSNLVIKNKDGLSALNFVCKYGDASDYYTILFSSLEALDETGTAEQSPSTSESPLHSFADRRRCDDGKFLAAELAGLILNSGFSINAKNKRKRTAIELAIARENLDLTLFLLENGALGKDDLLTFALGRENIHLPIIELLMGEGASLNDASKKIIEKNNKLRKHSLFNDLTNNNNNNNNNNNREFVVPSNTPLAPVTWEDAVAILPPEDEDTRGGKARIKALKTADEFFVTAMKRLEKGLDSWTVPMNDALDAYTRVYRNNTTAKVISHMKAARGAWNASAYLCKRYEGLSDKPGIFFIANLRKDNSDYEEEFKKEWRNVQEYPSRFPELKYKLARLYCPPSCTSCQGSGDGGYIFDNTCLACYGSGILARGTIFVRECFDCSGKGWYWFQGVEHKVSCKICRGSGHCQICDGNSRLPSYRKKCKVCNNQGFFTKASYGCNSCKSSKYYYWK